ncbi:unnamed protein product [Ectocarpus sp. 13 AM-2016]
MKLNPDILGDKAGHFPGHFPSLRPDFNTASCSLTVDRYSCTPRAQGRPSGKTQHRAFSLLQTASRLVVNQEHQSCQIEQANEADAQKTREQLCTQTTTTKLIPTILV